MVKKLRLLFEYGLYPLWLLNEEGIAIDMCLPDEWQDDKELDQVLTELMNRYDDLFIDNEKVFEYIGFKDEASRKSFCDLAEKAVEMVEKKNAGKYELINDYDIESFRNHTEV